MQLLPEHFNENLLHNPSVLPCKEIHVPRGVRENFSTCNKALKKEMPSKGRKGGIKVKHATSKEERKRKLNVSPKITQNFAFYSCLNFLKAVIKCHAPKPA